MYKCNYVDGKKNGLDIEWNPYGRLIGRANYKDGKVEGLCERWYDNGQLKLRVNCIDGKKVSVCIGTPMEKWIGGGITKTTRKMGVVRHLISKGQLVLKQHYKEGTLSGISESWQDNGQIKRRVNYVDGKFDGLYETWYANGQIEERRNYSAGKLDGLCESWNKDGTQNQVLVYKDNKLIMQVYNPTEFATLEANKCRFSTQHKPSDFSKQAQETLSRLPKSPMQMTRPEINQVTNKGIKL